MTSLASISRVMFLFIKISQDALPKGTNIKKLRIDAAGYQASIIENEARFVFRHNYPAKAINCL
jgi:hypothetical protein